MKATKKTATQLPSVKEILESRDEIEGKLLMLQSHVNMIKGYLAGAGVMEMLDDLLNTFEKGKYQYNTLEGFICSLFILETAKTD